MRERWSLLLSLTIIFIVQFWLMLLNHYSLRGTLLGLPTTAVVGSSAIVLLCALIVIIRRPTPIASLEIFSPWGARLSLLFLLLWSGALVVMPVGAFLVCLWLLFVLVIILVLFAVLMLFGGLHFGSATGNTDTSQINFLVGSLLVAICLCIAIVFFFNVVASLVKQAALPKRIERGNYIVQAIGLILTLAFSWGIVQNFNFGAQLRCSKQYLSPSGQRSIVVEDYSGSAFDVSDSSYSQAYLNGLFFKRDLGNIGDGSVCRKSNLTFNWSADEWQVDWEKLYP